MPQPLRVLVDGYFFGKPYGFGRVAVELCRALGLHPDPDVEVVVAVPASVLAAGLPSYPGLRWHAAPDRDLVRWQQLTVPRLARALAVDVVHSPYNTRALRTSHPTVVTVHDVMFLDERVPLRRLKDRVWIDYTRLVFKTAVPRSAAVVGDSDTTVRELARLGVRAETVYLTADAFVADNPPRDRAPGPRYLLHRGGSAPHRNTARVLEAFAAVRREVPDVELHVLGVADGALRFGVPDAAGVRFLPRVSDQELADLYAGSSAVVATSLAEGFGMPVLEGFGFGAPVVTSDVDPLKEVAGDAALLVDPYDVAAITAALLQVLRDDAVGADLVARGHRRREAFSAEQMARRMVEVYRRAAA